MSGEAGDDLRADLGHGALAAVVDRWRGVSARSGAAQSDILSAPMSGAAQG